MQTRPTFFSSPSDSHIGHGSSLSFSSSSTAQDRFAARQRPPPATTPRRARMVLPLSKPSLLLPLLLVAAATSIWFMELSRPLGNRIPFAGSSSSCDAQPKGRLSDAIHPSESVQHPLYQLLDEARSKWQRIHSSQSKTLKDAEAEYRRRYDLPPPSGFSEWFAWAQEHSVHFVDEYDALSETMAVLRGAGGQHLAARRDAFLAKKDARSHLVEISGGSCVEAIPEDMGSICGLIKDVLVEIGDVPALVYSSHDEGFVSVSHAEKERLKDMGKAGQTAGPVESYSPLAMPQFSSDAARGSSSTYHHLSETLCPPTSAARAYLATSPLGPSWNSLAADSHYALPMSSGGFVTDFNRQSDICEGVGWRESNGIALQFTDMMWRKDNFFPPNSIAPIFSQSRFSAQSDITIPTIYPGGLSGPPASIPWSSRKPKLVWRGQATGVLYPGNDDIGGDWMSSIRTRVHSMCTNRFGFSDVAWPEDVETDVLSAEEDDGENVRLRMSRMPNAEIIDRFLDCGLTGATFCGDKDCKSLKKVVDFVPELRDYEQFKYVLDVDGYGWSARFRNLLLRGSPVLKTTAFPEFHSPYLVPFYHFIPVRYDVADVPSIMTFFAGSPDDGASGSTRDELAEEIGKRGKEFVEKFWRDEDRTAYVWRVLLEYKRAMALP